MEAWTEQGRTQVEAVAAEAQIPAARVLGVRFERDAEGRMTGRFARCGDEASDAPVMSWKEGKRRWIRREIFGMAGDAAPVARLAGVGTAPGSNFAREALVRAALLARIAVGDKEPLVRYAAVKKVADPALLARIAIEDADEDVRRAAVKKVADQGR